MSSPNGDPIQRLSDIMAVEGIAPPHDQLRAAHEAVLSKWAKLAGKNFERNMNARALQANRRQSGLEGQISNRRQSGLVGQLDHEAA